MPQYDEVERGNEEERKRESGRFLPPLRQPQPSRYFFCSLFFALHLLSERLQNLGLYLFNRSLGFQKLQKTEHKESITWRKKGASSTLDGGDDVSAITHYDIRVN